MNYSFFDFIGVNFFISVIVKKKEKKKKSFKSFNLTC